MWTRWWRVWTRWKVLELSRTNDDEAFWLCHFLVWFHLIKSLGSWISKTEVCLFQSIINPWVIIDYLSIGKSYRFYWMVMPVVRALRAKKKNEKHDFGRANLNMHRNVLHDNENQNLFTGQSNFSCGQR